jgi:aldehyde dehydrogenase (NAD+)
MPRVSEILHTMDYGVAPEANDHVVAWLRRHGERFHHFIDGRFVEPAEGRTFDVIDPARGARLAEPARVDRGDGGEVARDERQHARRHDREQAREERDGNFL